MQLHLQSRTSAAVCVVAFSCLALFYSAYRLRKNLLCPTVEKPQGRFKKVLADNTRARFVHLFNRDGVHPYHERIQALLQNPPQSLTPYPFKTEPPELSEPCEWIETRSQLQNLFLVLSQQHEFAVDTEQHSMHSFFGYTSLIQISTTTKDYLVDTIALHDDMDILQPVFANQEICKVFHGADSDNLWLQRDFHIYIVNLFDTARACDVLGKPRRSLAYLLQKYCGVSTNKDFQRADWRQRPLPQEMLHYARVDTHYLLYIAHRLEDELIQGAAHFLEDDGGKESPFVQVVLRSNTLCLQLYDKDAACSPPSAAALSLISRYANSRAPSVRASSTEKDRIIHNLVKSLCEWRDNVARSEDESLQAVLSNCAVLALAVYCPTSTEGILTVISTADSTSGSSLLNPYTSPSAVVKRHVEGLCNLIKLESAESTVTAQSWCGKWATMIPLADIFTSAKKSWVASSLPARLSGSDQDSSEGAEQVPGGYDMSNLELNRAERRVKNGVKLKTGERCNQPNWQKSRAQFVKKFSCKAPVYHNCRIFAGDGRLLCYCDRKKLDWYVSRGLAEFVDEDPPAVKLLFEPKGRPEDENNEFYIQSKRNRCVGCGENSHYLRYRIIPSCYRQHFPEYLKSHRSHDIVLLCVDCHEIAHRAAERHKREIAAEFGVSLFAERNTGVETNVTEPETGVVGPHKVSPLRLKNAALAILQHGATLPRERREELEEVVKSYYGGRNFSKEELEAALFMSVGPRHQRRLAKYKGVTKISPSKKETSLEARSTNEQGTQESAFLSAITCREIEGNAESQLSASKHDLVSGNDADRRSENDSFAALITKAQQDSLLGHGPHGKKVVEILIEQGGDEAIRCFSHRWRRVFVNALEPAFLPPGWDIYHSGRREFGDHSVYRQRGKDS